MTIGTCLRPSFLTSRGISFSEGTDGRYIYTGDVDQTHLEAARTGIVHSQVQTGENTHGKWEPELVRSATIFNMLKYKALDSGK